MGSATRHSSRQSAASLPARKGKRRKTRREPAPRPPVDLDGLLGQLSDALSIIATAVNALVNAEERAGTANGGDVGDEIVTLHHGVSGFKRAYDALDVALREIKR